MSTTTPTSAAGLVTDHSRAQLDGAHTHGSPADGQVPDSSRADRLTSFDPADFPVPTSREEQWRFTPLARLRGLLDASATATEHLEVDVDAPEGIRTETVERTDARLGQVGAPGDRIAAQAWANASRAFVLTVPRGTEFEQPAHVTLTGTGGTEYGHALLVAEAGSAATVVLDFRGQGTLADNVEIDVADGAALTVVSIQDWDAGAVHVSSHRARIGRDARLKHVVVSLGGDAVRLNPSVRFEAPGGEVDMYGLYFADAGQHLEHQLFVDHAVENCRSRVTYKGALQGDGAHAVWIGDVLIRAAAEGTDTYELNRNLVLTDGARADSVPNLEIETGLIEGAGHASATGRFDDEQLFYLRSRGIPEIDARRLVVRGFFAELIHQIGIEDVENRLLAAIEDELAESMSELAS